MKINWRKTEEVLWFISIPIFCFLSYYIEVNVYLTICIIAFAIINKVNCQENYITQKGGKMNNG